MLFNPHPTKQAIKVRFCRTSNTVSHQPLTYNNKIKSTSSQKHLRLVLDSKLDFNQHIDKKNRCDKIIGIMKRLSLTSLEKAY